MQILVGQDPVSYNPNNSSASVRLSWLNDIARIRVGGEGLGVANGFEIQSVGNLVMMKLQHNGHVGIGTTSPSEKLEINGNLRLDIGGDHYMLLKPFVDVTNLNPGLTTTAASITGRKYGHLVMDIYSNDARDAFAIRTDTDFDGTLDKVPFVVNTFGRVGIGPKDPITKLHIEGASANWNETIPGHSYGTIHLSTGSNSDHFGNAITWGASDAGNAQAGIYVRSDGSYGTKMYFATTDAYITGAKTRLFINYNGKVGIGNTNPGYKLDILESGTAYTAHIRNSGTGSGRSGLLITTTDNTSNSYPLWVRGGNGAVTGLIVNSIGHVGIGTTSPIYKLSVNGTIGAKEVIVTNDGWADFVFEDDYNLMPLQELDSYIKENKHLPEIPTTEEVEENGISVGEMNAKLLQKIEELTLHTIEQQKEIDNQKELIEKQHSDYTELKNEIEELKKLMK